ncbi:MAG: hypothetical protein JO153_21190 [Solirubrobacterales bacterium]|nr:hypothetical protein [Solirubrobacterales bacterium]
MTQLSERERALLEFAARHRLVLDEHAQALLGISPRQAASLLRGLADARMLAREPPQLRGRLPCYRATAAGLRAIGSRLPPPRFSLSFYEHDIGLAWLHLAARVGKFGPARTILSEREMRSYDAARERVGLPFGVRLGGPSADGWERLHYPDLLLELQTGHRVALELELTGKGRARRERILGGYAAEPRIDAVVYLAENPSVRRSLRATAASLGISSCVHVHKCVWGESMRGRDRGMPAARTAGRELELAVAR